MNDAIRHLEPKKLWNNFADLNGVPRPSKGEERVIAFMRNFGEKLGLEITVDDAGNVLIRKDASPGMEDRPTVVLQSHLDMVHQKNADTAFDFEKEGIRCKVEGDWVYAEGTTLGADNGIGVSAIMAILESDDIAHPPLEALFTIDEETGMTGAKGLQKGFLKGRVLLNLDTEEDNELTIGCAGGIDTNTFFSYREIPPEGGAAAFRISVKGLKGGHSGMDIHKGRANANKVMSRLLYKMTTPYDLRIAEIDGGGLRNAIPRESFATVVVGAGKKDAFTSEFWRRAEAIKKEYFSIDPGMKLLLEKTDRPEKVMHPEDQEKILAALYAVPNGVFRMSPDIEDLVETSTSLARVIVKDGLFTTQSLQRSAIESGKINVANAVRAAFEAIGAAVENDGEYPGWAPDPDSPVLKTMEGLYEELFPGRPHVAACHAGLECGIIGDHYPGMDMISFGPTIQHAHSPDERVQISSVQKFWKYLLAALERIPDAG
jgi:dipeptidase D